MLHSTAEAQTALMNCFLAVLRYKSAGLTLDRTLRNLLHMRHTVNAVLYSAAPFQANFTSKFDFALCIASLWLVRLCMSTEHNSLLQV